MSLGMDPSHWGYYHLPVPDLDSSRATTHRLRSKPGSRTGQEMITGRQKVATPRAGGVKPREHTAPRRYLQARSALLLLMTGILANNHNGALTLDDLALLAHGLYRRPNLHGISSLKLLK